MIICVDAGHGFNSKTGKGDTGAVNGGLYECASTLATAKILKKELEALGHTVIMTRNDVDFVTLADRCKIANNSKCQLFISLHCNSSTNKTAQGIETWKYVSSNNPYAVNVQKRLIEATGAKDRGVKDGTFYVLKNTRAKAILVEMGFISHEEEKLKLFKTSYQTAIAKAIAQGVSDT